MNKLNPGIVFLKLVAVPVGLVVIISYASSELPELNNPTNPLLLAASLGVNQLAMFIVALRLKFSLLTRGYELVSRFAVRIHFQSMYYFFVMPMTVGIEVSRIAKLIMLQPKFSKLSISFGTLFDRLLGFLITLLTALLFSTSFVEFDEPISALGLQAALLAVTLGMAGAYFMRKQITNFIKEFSLVPAVYAFLIGVPSHILFCVACWLGSSSLGFQIDLSTIIFVTSASTMLMILPISLGGAGVAEATGVGIWVWLGFEVEAALILAAIPFVLRLVIAVQGAIWEMYEGVFGVS